MRIVHLTPGTGNFHCGSCLRDNILVKELRRLGHDVVMVPLYLPLVLDDEPASPDVPVFLGGINMFLQEKVPLFRYTPRWFDKLFDSDALLRKAADKSSMTTAEQLGQMILGSFLAADGRQAKEWRKLIEWIGSHEPKFDLVSLSNGLLIGIAKTIHRELGLPVVSTLQGEDTFLDSLPEPYRSTAWEAFRTEAAHVDRFFAVSEYYASVMRRRLELGEDRIGVVLNGIDLEPFSQAERPPKPPTIGFLARLHHCKGLHTLVDAFIVLKKRRRIPDLRLRVAGSKIAGDEDFVEAQIAKLADAGVLDDAEFRANIDINEKIAFLKSLSVLSVPATYGESFGLFVIEALACGVPVVKPRHGAFPELLAHTGGGVLCEPDDPVSLADEIEALLLDEPRRRRLGEEGRQAVLAKFSVARMAKDFESGCRAVLSGRATPPAAEPSVPAIG